MVSKRTKCLIWISWFALVPAGFWLIYAAFPPQVTGKMIDIIAFLILMCIVASIPIMIGKTAVVVFQGVSLAVFLIFGLATELVITQIAVMVMLINLKVRSDQIFRFPAELTHVFLHFSRERHYILPARGKPSSGF
ncbi:hypothetical protein [Peribacillus sp. SCS-37]|uniref:hypothetical protein n=1 Tax=Paraperibacillus esterisolvens TaxID=3115296 RepID=UPI00390682D7